MEYKQLYQTEDIDLSVAHANSIKNLKELQRIDKENSQPGNILYRYFYKQINDGRAYYQVIKVNKTSCVIKVCKGICLDEWDDGAYPMTRKMAEEYISKRIFLEELFG